ncbi:3-phosphoserine/phosphohydroxythreonine transaminase [Buchnera aphidicola]|uniref:3-phosphoserine/phosphohydroxythreonine transaminase n=1 Tax=Buchnera aphidicola TaxID=9 RepID=UPI003463900A
MEKIYNFSAGPAMLPIPVMNRIKQDLCNWKGLGTSVMEISHRSEYFLRFVRETEEDLRELLEIPSNYKVLFCQGGARGQFSAIPVNLLNQSSCNPDYIESGYWSQAARIEAEKYCTPNVINIRKKFNKTNAILSIYDWKISSQSAYIHYCPNETIDGIAIYEEPSFDDKIIIGDFSSMILSRIINIKKYGLIYASAQKNIGIAGITLVIIRDDLLKNNNIAPSILNYQILSNNNSMFNTPPTFSWYISGLIFKWLKNIGGIKKIQEINNNKADLLYKTIDNSNLYINNINNINRSNTNVTFQLLNNNLNNLFLKESYDNGLHALKGHCIVGGFRASIYNAMPIEGVEKLAKFMIDFEDKYV